MTYIENKLYKAYLTKDFDRFLIYCKMLINVSEGQNTPFLLWDYQFNPEKNTTIKLGDMLLAFNTSFSEKTLELQYQLQEIRREIIRCSEYIEQESAKEYPSRRQLNQTKALKKQAESRLKTCQNQYRSLIRSSQDALRLIHELHQRTQQIKMDQTSHLVQAIPKFKWYHHVIQWFLSWFSFPPLPTTEYTLTEKARQTIILEFPEIKQQIEVTNHHDVVHQPPLNAQIAHLFRRAKKPTAVPQSIEMNDDPIDQLQIVQVYHAQQQMLVEQQTQNTEFEQAVIQERLATRVDAQIEQLKQDKSSIYSSNEVTNKLLHYDVPPTDPLFFGSNMRKFEKYSGKHSNNGKYQHWGENNQFTAFNRGASESFSASAGQLERRLHTGHICLNIPGHDPIEFGHRYSRLRLNISEDALDAYLIMRSKKVSGHKERLIDFDPISSQFVLPPGMFCELKVSQEFAQDDKVPYNIVTVIIKYNPDLEKTQKQRSVVRQTRIDNLAMLSTDKQHKQYLRDESLEQVLLSVETTQQDAADAFIKTLPYLSSEHQAFLKNPFDFADDAEARSFYGVIALMAQQNPSEKLCKLLDILADIKKNEPCHDVNLLFRDIIGRHEWTKKGVDSIPLYYDQSLVELDLSLLGYLEKYTSMKPIEKTWLKYFIFATDAFHVTEYTLEPYYNNDAYANNTIFINAHTRECYVNEMGTFKIPQSIALKPLKEKLKDPAFKQKILKIILDASHTQATLLEIFQSVQLLSNLSTKKNVHLPEPPTDYAMPYADLRQHNKVYTLTLLGLIHCLSYATAPKALLRMPWSEWPRTNDYAIYMLRAGYTVLHRDMLIGWKNDERIFSAAVAKTFLDIDPIRLSARIFVELCSEKIPDSWYDHFFDKPNEYRRERKALWLRYIALHKDPRYFEAALEKWDTFQKATFSDLKPDSPEEELCRFRQACVFALQLPWKTNYRSNEDLGPLPLPEMGLPTATAKEFASIWQRITSPDSLRGFDAVEHGLEQNGSFQYAPGNQQVLFDEEDIKLSIKAFTKTDSLRAHVMAMNKDYVSCIMLTPVELLDKLKSLKKNKDTPLHLKLLYLMEAEARLTKRQLRLEQVLVILDALENQALYDIKTSEGKTTILKFIALLSALDGKTVDIITHNDFLAKEGAQEAIRLAMLCDLRVAHKDEPDSSSANILYSEASRMVFDHMLSGLNDISPRKADLALADEFDQLILDMATTDMELPNLNSTTEINEAALIALAKLMMDNPNKTANDILQLEEIRTIIQDHQISLNDLKFWVQAGIQATKLRVNVNYVLYRSSANKPPSIQMIHQGTHGRRDPQSIWGKGVHQMVAALESARNTRQIVLPPFTPAIAQENIISYLKSYKKINGFTATTGNTPEVSEFLCKVLTPAEGTESIPLIHVLRAKRMDIPATLFPRVPTTEGKKKLLAGEPLTEEDTEALRHRCYYFPVMLCHGKQNHYEHLLEALCNAQNRQLSTLVFFDTIAECEQFYNYLLENSLDVTTLQIYDDAGSENSGIERAPEKVLIEEASLKRKITICTAAAGRGIDFKKVDAAIAAKPVMDRILQQELARVARNGELAIAHTIINEEDIGFSGDWSQENRTQEEIFSDWMREKQDHQLKIVQNKQAMSNIKYYLQTCFFSQRKQLNLDQRVEFDKRWSSLLSEFDEAYQPNLSFQEQAQIHQKWCDSLQRYLMSQNVLTEDIFTTSCYFNLSL